MVITRTGDFQKCAVLQLKIDNFVTCTDLSEAEELFCLP